MTCDRDYCRLLCPISFSVYLNASRRPGPPQRAVMARYAAAPPALRLRRPYEDV